MAFYTQSAFYARSAVCTFIKYQTLDKTLVLGHFEFEGIRKAFRGKIVSFHIFGQTTGYRISIVSREPIRLPKIQYPVFGIRI